MSLHKTREGAEKAVQEHKDMVKSKFEKGEADFKKEGIPGSNFAWDFVQEWDVQETDLLD